MDEDQACQGAIAQIYTLSRAVQHIQVPQGKDINDFYLIESLGIVTEWIQNIALKSLLLP
ncbi:hypothetical protein G4Y79_18525 [Phototrophicus methaneseepsis]|uniref:Uncharacterized protein n=1 Tax=Phototrophicus methaneseepsis TaxID=2710758 RepID=A0A7S8E796_9CHLR|nr:hypothetical protein [Phototrophicus methaneseepsis]QPC81667.1 hypothetical protein G4Y79_18525 [Phototrophicus methaneseepsis]